MQVLLATLSVLPERVTSANTFCASRFTQISVWLCSNLSRAERNPRVAIFGVGFRYQHKAAVLRTSVCSGEIADRASGHSKTAVFSQVLKRTLRLKAVNPTWSISVHSYKYNIFTTYQGNEFLSVFQIIVFYAFLKHVEAHPSIFSEALFYTVMCHIHNVHASFIQIERMLETVWSEPLSPESESCKYKTEIFLCSLLGPFFMT